MDLTDTSVPLEERIAAVRQLAEGSATDAVIDTLLKGLDLRSEFLRDEIVAALRKIQAEPVLFARATDREVPLEQRLEALVGLRNLRPTDGRALAPLLKESDPKVREAAAEVFVVFGAESVEAQLIDAVKDPVPDVRYYAVLAVGQLKSPQAKTAISRAFVVEKNALVQDALGQAARQQKS